MLLLAIPHPAYANVVFEKQRKAYTFQSLVMSDFMRTDQYLQETLSSLGYHLVSAVDLPMKRLAVRSGLAVYGRNNITYSEGMGSFLSLAAYFSDIPCESEDWSEIRLAKACTNCQICTKNCPTGAIRKERFLIHNERCLSYLNESPGEFPAWLPETVHHTLYDCLRCQLKCPMNKDHVNQVIEGIRFSENETQWLLSGCAYQYFPSALQEKADQLGLTDWLPAIPRNLKVLFKLSENN